MALLWWAIPFSPVVGPWESPLGPNPLGTIAKRGSAFPRENTTFLRPRCSTAPFRSRILPGALVGDLVPADPAVAAVTSISATNVGQSTPPIGIDPKRTPNQVCLIHHLSHRSVNDNIPADCSTIHYATINQAVKIVQRSEVGCFLAKSDTKSAFRIIPMHPQYYLLLGIKWADNYYYDRCLPMGCSSSCAIFEALRTSLEWLSMQKFRASAVLHIFDYFLVCGLLPRKMSHRFGFFLRLGDFLGVPITQGKTV